MEQSLLGAYNCFPLLIFLINICINSQFSFLHEGCAQRVVVPALEGCQRGIGFGSLVVELVPVIHDIKIRVVLLTLLQLLWEYWDKAATMNIAFVVESHSGWISSPRP